VSAHDARHTTKQPSLERAIAKNPDSNKSKRQMKLAINKTPESPPRRGAGRFFGHFLAALQESGRRHRSTIINFLTAAQKVP